MGVIAGYIFNGFCRFFITYNTLLLFYVLFLNSSKSIRLIPEIYTHLKLLFIKTI